MTGGAYITDGLRPLRYTPRAHRNASPAGGWTLSNKVCYNVKACVKGLSRLSAAGLSIFVRW